MFFSEKKEKNKRLPNIQTRNNLYSKFSLNKYFPKEKANIQLLPKYKNYSNRNPNIAIINNFKKNSPTNGIYLNLKRNNSMLNIKNKKRFKDFEKIKIFKGKPVEIPNKSELYKYKNRKNVTKLSKEFNERKIYLFKKNFNYNCKIDKNETFNLSLNLQPKETLKQIIYNSYNNQIKMEDNEFRHPRMVNILKENTILYNEVFYQPWKYPDLFFK
jgi:hypothetical protein